MKFKLFSKIQIIIIFKLFILNKVIVLAKFFFFFFFFLKKKSNKYINITILIFY